MHDNRRPRLLVRAGRTLAGVALGTVLALGELALGCVAVVFLLPTVAVPRARGRLLGLLHRCAGQLAAHEQHRLARFHGADDLGPYSGRQAFGYVVRRWPLGLLGGLVLVLLLFGLAVAATMLSAWVLGGSWSFLEEGDGGGRVTTETVATALVPGLVLLYLAVMGIVGVAELDVRLARRHLTPSVEDVLTRRVSELVLSRSEVVQVVNDERRRIERDLHDGVQQRLVALGLLLSRARRTKDPVVAADLVRQAHEESQQALGDLRDVAWRVYPTVLDQLGLHDVLTALAERSAIPVTLRYELAGRPPAPIETVAYFVVSEALTNATKHSGATRIGVTLAHPPDDATRLLVTVTDDGRGGADQAGRGLGGLAGRVAASEGTFTVDSPPGGPTTIRAELPCG